jgi:hypothetical protein
MEGKGVDVALLRNFSFDRVLNDGIMHPVGDQHVALVYRVLTDPLVHSLFVLGKLPHGNSDSPAIISLQRTHLSIDLARTLVQDLVEEVKPLESNDIVHFSYLNPDPVSTDSLA